MSIFSHSTPPRKDSTHKSASLNQGSNASSTPLSSQKALKSAAGKELHLGTFESRYLITKAFSCRDEVADEFFDYASNYRSHWGENNDKPWKFRSERESYPAFVFLFERIRKAYLSHPAIQSTRDTLYFRDLVFNVYDRPMSKRFNDTKGALKLDLLGVFRSLEGNKSVDWNEVEIAGDMKSNSWPDLIRQCATYARCMFAAHENRRFCILFAVNHKDLSMRFCVFN